MAIGIRFLIAVFLGLIFYTDVAWAGWVVTYADSETGEKRQNVYTEGKMKFGESIFAKKYVIVADKGSSSYWKGTPRQYCDALSEMKKKMEEQLASLPAEYQPKPIDNSKVSRKQLGTKRIAGYSATGYEFFEGEVGHGPVWVSSDPALSELISLQNAKNDEYECFDEMMGPAGIEDSALYEKTMKGSFVLKEAWQQVVSVERKNLSSDIFDAPKGYKSFNDYQKFMEYMSNNQSRSSSSSSYSSGYVPQDMPESDNYSGQESFEDQEDNLEMDAEGYPDEESQQRTEKEVSEGIHKDIKKGVGGLLKKVIW